MEREISTTHKETLTTMVQINDFEWKDGTMLPECCLTHLGIETSHEVIAVIEDNGYRSTLVLQYHLHRGWEYANGVELKAVFKDAVILQWSYIPRPVQRWQESFNE